MNETQESELNSLLKVIFKNISCLSSHFFKKIVYHNDRFML